MVESNDFKRLRQLPPSLASFHTPCAERQSAHRPRSILRPLPFASVITHYLAHHSDFGKEMLRKAERSESSRPSGAPKALPENAKPGCGGRHRPDLVSPVGAAEPSKFVSSSWERNPAKARALHASSATMTARISPGIRNRTSRRSVCLRRSTPGWTTAINFGSGSISAIAPGRSRPWPNAAPERARFAPKGCDLRRYGRRRSACGRKQEIRPVEFAAQLRSLPARPASARQSRQRRLRRGRQTFPSHPGAALAMRGPSDRRCRESRPRSGSLKVKRIVKKQGPDWSVLKSSDLTATTNLGRAIISRRRGP